MKKIIFLILIIHLSLLLVHAQWVYQYSGVTSELRDIEFINSSTGWICGDNGTILKTTNGGINWILQSNEAIGKLLLGIHPVNENIVYCVGYFETILKTTNGGNNWKTIQNGPIGEGDCYMSVYFLNENTGWIGVWGGTSSGVMKTTDGGSTWTESITSCRFMDMCFKDSLNGIGVDEVSIYAVTNNGGVNWVVGFTGQGNYYDISLMPYNKDIGFIVSSQNVRKTTNFGVTFDSVGRIPYVVPPYSIYCSKFISENIGWAGGSYGVLYKTENGGRSWGEQNSLSQTFIGRIYALNDTVVWAVGGGGKIIHTTNGGGGTITSVRQISSNVPDKIELIQNYPNPFNSKSIIKYKITGSADIKLVVYSITGKEIETLVEQRHQAGTYEVIFDGSNLASGVYFYRLGTGNNYIVKKMILIK